MYSRRIIKELKFFIIKEIIMKRASGILLPVFSLPSPYGIGTIYSGKKFIDFLSNAAQRYWQILPLGPAFSLKRNVFSSSISFTFSLNLPIHRLLRWNSFPSRYLAPQVLPHLLIDCVPVFHCTFPPLGITMYESADKHCKDSASILQ